MTKNTDKTKIVGHRGAAGVALENSIPGFSAARKMGVDAIELDIQVTKDHYIVVCHDDNLKRLTGQDKLISDLTMAELIHIPLEGGQIVPLLRDVLDLVQDVPIVLDIKIDNQLQPIFDIMKDYPNISFTVVTSLPSVVKASKQLRPDIPAFIQRHYTPFGLMKSIKKYGADGLNLNYLWMNPLIYRATQKRGMQIQVYTVNNQRVAWLLKRLYPGIWICTNHPDKFLTSLSD